MSEAVESPTPLLEFRGINTHYGAVHILKDVDLAIYPGELVCLLGGNASGKSTTLKTLLGMVTPTTGEVVLDGEVVNDKPTFVVFVPTELIRVCSAAIKEVPDFSH